MSTLRWTVDLSVGIDELDFHHRRIFTLIDDLQDAISASRDNPARIADVVAQLVDYAEYHLKKEEEYFDQCGYAGAQQHKRQHDLYRVKVKEMAGRIETPGISEELAAFLGEWWVNHIQHEDKRYTDSLHACGLQ